MDGPGQPGGLAGRLARALGGTVGRILLGLVGIASLTAAGGLVVLSQTVVGRRFVQDFVEDALNGTVKAGEVRIGPILGGDLLSGALLARFEITDPDGRLFVALDSVRLRYNPLSLLVGTYRFDAVTVRRVELVLRQHEDGRWNFDRIFEGESPPPPDEEEEGRVGGARVLLADVRIDAGTLDVVTPWAHDLSGAARDSAVRQGLRGDRLWRVRSVAPERYERVISLRGLQGRFPLIRLVDPVRPMRIDAEGLSARLEAVTQPLDVRRFDGSATFRDTVDIRLAHLALGSSAASGSGWVVPADPVQFSFSLDADPIGFADLQWLPLPLPSSGGGPAEIVLSTRGETIVVDAAGGDVRVDDSRVRGAFRLALEDVPRFEALDLRLEPVRLSLVDEILDRPPGIDGRVSGTVRGSGPIDLVRLAADLELTDLPGPDARPPSRLGVTGGLSMVEPRRMGDLVLDFRSFEPRWAAVIGLEPGLSGRTTGSLRLDGVAGGRFSFQADVSQAIPGRDTSRITGRGTLDLRDRREIDATFFFDPLAVALVESWLPERVDILGEVRGDLAVRGAPGDLSVAADLRTPRGLLDFDGRFDVESEEKRYDARLLARDIQLAEWIPDGPRTRLAVEGRIEGRGTDPATLEARFDLAILPSLLEGASLDTGFVRFTLAGGLATADTFALRSPAGSVDGRGAFGISGDRSGSLILDVAVPDLSLWNAWLVEGRNPARIDEDVSDLFARFGAGDGRGEAQGEAADTLSGRLEALGVLHGNVQRPSFGGRVEARDVSWGELHADSLQITADLPDLRASDSLAVRVAAVGSSLYGRTLDSLDVLWARNDPETHEIRLYARRDTTVEIQSDLTLRWTETAKSLRLERLELLEGARTLSLREPALVTWGDGGFAAHGVRLAGRDGGLLEVDGTVPDSGAVSLEVRARDVRIENLLAGIGNPNDLRGRVRLDASIRGSAAAPLGEIDLRLDEPSVRGIGYERLTVRSTYAGRRLGVDAALVTGETEIARLDGLVRADLSLRPVDRRLLDDPIELTLVVDSMPLRAVELQVESLRDVHGHAIGRVDIGGRPGELQLEGEIRVLDVAATVPSLGVRYRDGIGRFVFAGSSARIDTLSLVSSAGGRAIVGGRIGLADPRDVTFDLDLKAQRLRGIDRRSVSARIDGEGRLDGSFRRPELTGRFRLSDGEFQAERFARQAAAVDLTDPAVYALLDTTLAADRRLLGRVANPFMQNLRIEATIAVGPDFWLRSSALEMELTGELDIRMDRAAGDLTALGTLSLPRGKFRYQSGTSAQVRSLYSRQLQIERGEITFVGTPGLDPNLDIDALYRARGDLGPVAVNVHVGGTMLAPTMTTSSDPPLPESDRICYLLFSTACFGAGSEGGDFAASLVREGLLGTVSSQVSQVLVGGTGIVDYVDIRSTGAGQAGPAAGQSGLLFGTEVEIGRYLTPDLFVRATQPFGGQLPGLTVDWSFLPRWRLEFRTEDRFDDNYSAYGYSFSAFSLRTYGLMLFREWNF